jgi:ATP-dependent RNA helicase DeaD
LKEKDLEKYTRMAEALIADEITSFDVAAALLKMMFASEKREQEQKADIFTNASSNKYTNTGARNSGMARLFINIGKKDNVRAGDFVGAIAGETGISGNSVGNIKILDAFSFVEVPQDQADNVINALHSSNIKGKRVSVELAKGNSSGSSDGEERRSSYNKRFSRLRR